MATPLYIKRTPKVTFRVVTRQNLKDQVAGKLTGKAKIGTTAAEAQKVLDQLAPGKAIRVMTKPINRGTLRVVAVTSAAEARELVK